MKIITEKICLYEKRNLILSIEFKRFLERVFY